VEGSGSSFDREVWLALPGSRDYLHPVHARHLQIDQQQVQ
jgi:hypothetical protein